MQEVVDGYPACGATVRTYLDERTGSGRPAPTPNSWVRVYGEDSAVLDAKAGEVGRCWPALAGVQDPDVQRVPLRPTLQVEVDLARAQQQRIKPGDVRRTVATLLAGIEVGSLFEDQKVFEVVVWGTPDLRGSVTASRTCWSSGPRRRPVRVGDVAEVRVAPAPAVVQRDSSSRYVDVTADDRRARVRRGLDRGAAEAGGHQFPFEHRAEMVDDYASGRRRRRVVGVAAVALALVFCSSRPRSRSWRLALLCLALLPAALSGGAVAAVLGGRVSRSARSWACSRWGAVAIHRMLASDRGLPAGA